MQTSSWNVPNGSVCSHSQTKYSVRLGFIPCHSPRKIWSHWRCSGSKETLSNKQNRANTKKCHVSFFWFLCPIQWKISDLSARNIDINRLKVAISTCSMLFDALALNFNSSKKMKKAYKSNIEYKNQAADSGHMQDSYNGFQHLSLNDKYYATILHKLLTRKKSSKQKTHIWVFFIRKLGLG